MCLGWTASKLSLPPWAHQQRLTLFSSWAAIHLSVARLRCYLLLEMAKPSLGSGALWSHLQKGLSTCGIIHQLLHLDWSSSSPVFYIFESPESILGSRTLEVLNIYQWVNSGGKKDLRNRLSFSVSFGLLKKSKRKEVYWRLVHRWLMIITVQFSSVAQSCLIICDREAHQASGSVTNSWSLLKLMSIELVMPSNPLILYRPLLLLPSVFPSIRVLSNESVLCIRWPKYWSFSFSISPSSEYSEMISFRIDWLDLLAVQETLKGLLQHNSSKASILLHSAFFIVQLPHPYMTTGKTIALTRQTCWQSNVSAF